MDAAIAAAEEREREQAAELARRESRIEDLELVATRLSERVVEREGELRELRAELARTTSDSNAHLATLTALLGELEDLRRSARGQATRIRLEALREAAALSERVAELAKRPGGLGEGALGALTDALARIAGEGAEAGDPPADEKAPVVPATNGHGEVEPAELFQGLIEVEIGPLSDFAQLLGFEDAAKSIGAASEIAVTRFSEGRATLELSLDEPVELLRELEARCDLEFVIRDMRADRLVLDVGE